LTALARFATKSAMGAHSDPIQRIARLTPLRDVVAMIEARVSGVAPQEVDLGHAFGRVLAADLVAPADCPPAAIALRDGFAVRAELTRDAGPYAPAPLPRNCVRIEVGQGLPAETDAIALLDAVIGDGGGAAQAVAPVAPGEGVLAAGADAAAGFVLKQAGERLGCLDLAALAACGVARVRVRAPRVRLFVAAAPDRPIAAARDLITAALAREGAVIVADRKPAQKLEAALRDDSADAVLVIGGTGSGRNDFSITTLQRVGQVDVHGVALTPGETAAFGFGGARPVLMLPGRIDAALAVWLLLGRILLARLAGLARQEPPSSAVLSRKVTSTLGLSELVPVRRDGERVEPLASGYLPLSALAKADGFILIEADSEGFAQGTRVAVWPWP
jgi:molybdopterin molybdotransferase